MVKTKIALVKPFLRDCCFEEAGQCITHATRSECTFRLDPHSPPIGPPLTLPPPSSPKWSAVHTCIHPKLKQQEGTLHPYFFLSYILEPYWNPNWARSLFPLIPSQMVISACLHPSQTQIIRERMKMRMTIVTITIMTMTIFEDDNNDDGNNDDYNDNDNDDNDDDDKRIFLE